MLFPSKNITTIFPFSVFPLTKGCPFYQWKDVLPTTQACNLWVIFESVMHRILELGKIFKDTQSNSFTFQIRTCSWKTLVFCKFTLWGRTRPNILNPHPSVPSTAPPAYSLSFNFYSARCQIPLIPLLQCPYIYSFPWPQTYSSLYLEWLPKTLHALLCSSLSGSISYPNCPQTFISSCFSRNPLLKSDNMGE